MSRSVVVLELIVFTLVCSANARLDLYPCPDPFSYRVADSIAVDCNNGSFMVYNLVTGDREIRPGLELPFEHGRSYNDIKEYMIELHLNVTVMRRKTFVVWQDLSMDCDRLYVNDALYDDNSDGENPITIKYEKGPDILTKQYNQSISNTKKPEMVTLQSNVSSIYISPKSNSKTYVVLSFISNVKELEAECLTRGENCTFVHVDPRHHLILFIIGIFLTFNAIVCSSVVAFIYTYQRYKHYEGVSTHRPDELIN